MGNAEGKEASLSISTYETTKLVLNDKCRTCNRGISADIVCSNIGIACQPAEEVECLERQKSDDKK
jgi:hypothetical protein